MPRIKQSVEETVMGTDGTIYERRQNRTLAWGDEPPYIKLYLKDLMYMSDMPKHYTNLVYALLKRVSYAGDDDGMCVTLVPRTKKAICKELGWEKTSSLDNALQRLLKGKIIYRVDRGVFRMNPYLFGKGEWQDISRIRMEITYDSDGKTFMSVCEHDEHSKQEQEPAPVPVQKPQKASKRGFDSYPDTLPGQMEMSDYAV